jgi:hypothetical protein
MGIKRPIGVTVYRRKRSDRRNGVSAYLRLRTPIPKTLISRIFIHRYSYVMIFQIFIMNHAIYPRIIKNQRWFQPWEMWSQCLQELVSPKGPPRHGAHGRFGEAKHKTGESLGNLWEIMTNQGEIIWNHQVWGPGSSFRPSLMMRVEVGWGDLMCF